MVSDSLLRSFRALLKQGLSSVPASSSIGTRFVFSTEASACSKSASKKPTGSTPASLIKRLGIANVQHIVAVTSAKGGVGKSTCAANIAVALATALQLRTGLLDADIHGPSIGKMMNLSGKPGIAPGPQALLQPKENYRVKCMSMAFFMDQADQPVAWRGPMVNNAFDKMLIGTDWGHLDVLVVDMPPGTGDAQINLGQRIPMSGAIIVSTPQDIALLDARRGAMMLQRMRTPLLGMVSNMASHQCVKCGHVEHVFGQGGVQQAAADFGTEVLGEIPLDLDVRVFSDSGAPVVVSRPASAPALAFVEIARRLHATLGAEGGTAQPAPPLIKMQ